MSVINLPVARLPVPGIPERCPHCQMPVAFPLYATTGRLVASCPACHEPVAVIAVTAPERSET